MNPGFHASQARRLVRLIGGVEAAAEIAGVSHQCISNYQNSNVRAFMPAHIITALESEAGSAVYSAAMVNLVAPVPSRSLLCDALDLGRIAGRLPAEIHEAMEDGRLDETERRALSALADDLKSRAEAIQAALTGEGSDAQAR